MKAGALVRMGGYCSGLHKLAGEEMMCDFLADGDEHELMMMKRVCEMGIGLGFGCTYLLRGMSQQTYTEYSS
jgi:hypothetical protein